MYIVSLYVLLCMFSLYDSSTLFITSTENLSSWKVFVNEEIRNQYNRELFHATVYMAVIFCLGFITCFFYVVPTEQDGRIYFAIPISAMYFPNYINFFFVWCCRAAFIPAAYLSIVQPTLRIMYCWIHFQDILADQYPRIILLGISAFVVLFGLSKTGQEVEDMSSDIFDISLHVDWCDWNEANKKMYLMLLINTQKQFKIKYSDNISLNYQMGVEIVKTFFSIISVMSKLQKQL
ncbi:hypothetical protein Zmor_022538 [Zophobas morio]|uniref:Uncharacterized protein n=1 Tax=Zophobas morio TaxID=2755281 RepID=A0AA38HWP5_9CUCU|nr:hypothetical protein Zmor_022538 [Zophobas morio]